MVRENDSRIQYALTTKLCSLASKCLMAVLLILCLDFISKNDLLEVTAIMKSLHTFIWPRGHRT